MGMISLDDVVAAGKQLEISHRKISPHFIPRILTNMAAGHISIRHKFKVGNWLPAVDPYTHPTPPQVTLHH